jgi:molybdopterin-binding protein
MGGYGMRFSARNQIKGTVKKVTHGAVNSEVIVELPGGSQLVAIITKESAMNLGLQDGKTAYVIIKASDVMVGVDG